MSESAESHEPGAAGKLSRAGSSDALSRVLCNSLRLLGGSSAAAVIALAVTAYSARVLGANDFGTLAIVAAVATFLSRFFGVQCGSAILRFGTMLQAEGRDAELRALTRFGWRLEAAASVTVGATALLAILLWPAARSQLTGHWPLAIAYAAAVATNWSNTASGVLRLQDRFLVLSVQPIVVNVTRLIGLVIAHQAGDSLLAIGLAWAAGDISGNAYFAVCAMRKNSRNDSAGDMPQIARLQRNEISRFVLLASVHASIKSGLREADVLIVGSILGREGAGGYRIAKQAGGSLMKLVDPLMQSSFPEMARAAGRSANREVGRLLMRIALFAIAATLPLAAAFWVVGDWLIASLLGHQFDYARVGMDIYLIGSVIAAAGIALQPAALSLGLQAVSLRILAASVGVYLALLLLLTERAGLAGAAWAFVAFYAVWSIAMWWTVLVRTRASGVPG